MSNKKFFYYLVLFSWLTIPPIYKIEGTVNLNWIYVTLLDLILILILIVNIFKTQIILKSYLKYLLIFNFYLIISILWSYSYIDSFRYLNKFILLILIVINFSNSITEHDEIHKKIFLALIFFLFVNWIAELTIKNYLWKYPSGEFFEGLSGRHAIKYYVVFGLLFSITSYFIFREKKYLVVSILLFITLFLIFQRGAFLGLLIGSLVIFYKLFNKSFRFRLLFLFLLVLLPISLVYILLNTETGITYTFYSYEQRAKFINELYTDPLSSYKYIHFKGRLEYWDVLLNKSSQPFGIGFGSSGRIIEENFGQYNEVHNDWLQFFVELGLIGVILYFLFWYKLISQLNKLFNKNLSLYEKVFVLTTLGYSAFVMVNGIVDHVIDYQSTSICLAILITLSSSVNEKK